VGAEGPANDFAQRHGAVDDEQAGLRVEHARSIGLSISAWTTVVPWRLSSRGRLASQTACDICASMNDTSDPRHAYPGFWGRSR
jgi:hypothetical protein